MAKNRCPLCSGRLNNGVCESCGYAVPDEEGIASVYNYDPSDYNYNEEKYGEKDKSSDMMPEIKTYDGAPPVFYRREEVETPAAKPVIDLHAKAEQHGKAEEPENNPNPYADFSPTDNRNIYNSGSGSGKGGIFDFRFIIDLILTMIFPLIGIFYILNRVKLYNSEKSQKYMTQIIIIAAVMMFSFISGFSRFD